MFFLNVIFWFQDLFNYNETAKNGYLTASLYEQDESGKFDDVTSIPNTNRRNEMKNSKIFEVGGPLHADVFNIKNQIPNNVDMRITLTLNTPAVSLIGSSEDGGILRVIDASLYIRKCVISPTVVLAQAKALETNMMIYPYRKTDVTSLTLPAGTRRHTVEQVFLGRIPTRIIVGIVDNAAFNGSFKKSPFNFHHFDLNYLSLSVNGREYFNNPFTPDYSDDGDNYTMEYLSTYFGTNLFYSDDGYGVTRKQYKNGFCLYCFDLTGNLSASQEYWSAPEEGQVRMELGFATALPSVVSVVIYSEERDCLTIDRNRNCSIEYGR
jgi:hypothetical protein